MGVKVCPQDGEPVVFTLKHPGSEYVCVVCDWKGGVLSPLEVDATPELIDRQNSLLGLFYEREGIAPPNQNKPTPMCVGCGSLAEGQLDHSGKPPHWYQRTKDGVNQYACSRECIPDGLVMPW